MKGKGGMGGDGGGRESKHKSGGGSRVGEWEGEKREEGGKRLRWTEREGWRKGMMLINEGKDLPLP